MQGVGGYSSQGLGKGLWGVKDSAKRCQTFRASTAIAATAAIAAAAAIAAIAAAGIDAETLARREGELSSVRAGVPSAGPQHPNHPSIHRPLLARPPVPTCAPARPPTHPPAHIHPCMSDTRR